jgi:sporulation protein YlmC with PRC-barrel domain
MRLSDLLEHEVVDQTGRSWGQVHDVRLVADGPLLPSRLAAFRIHGLVAGRGSLGTRLGYTPRGPGGDTVTRGPLPLKLLFQWLHRNAVYIPWQAVTAVEDSAIRVTSPADGFERLRS